MAENTKIEWAHHTFNPWIGCAKVSPGCKHCYAETLMDTRYGRVEWGVNGTRVRTGAASWAKPMQWNKKAEKEGIRYRVFCSSLADVFEDRNELQPWRAELFDLMRRTPQLDWLLLTKRPENILPLIHAAVIEIDAIGVEGVPRSADTMITANWLWEWYKGRIIPANIWIGTSVENQEAADERIPHLLRMPAAVRFLSCEPLLGPVNIFDEGWPHPTQTPIKETLGPGAIDWVIVGGESGSNARPMHPDWARSLRDQCFNAYVPFLFKQWGEWVELSQAPVVYNLEPELRERTAQVEVEQNTMPNQCKRITLLKVGKHATGRLLDGRLWDQVPDGYYPSGQRSTPKNTTSLTK